MKSLSRKKRICFSLILFFLITCICILLAEVVIRIVYPQPVIPRFVQKAPWGIHKTAPNINGTHKTPEYSYRYRTNSQGFRGTTEYEIVPPENCLRIVVQGDSVTLGMCVEDNETYSYFLEEMLRKDGIRAEVINMGVAGFGTAEELIQFNEVARKYKPDIMILGFFANDIMDNPVCRLFTIEDGVLRRTETDYFPGIHLRDRLLAIPGYSFFSKHSHLLTFLRNEASTIVWQRLRKKAGFPGRFAGRKDKDDAMKNSTSILLTKLLLQRYADDVTQTGAKLLLVDILGKQLNSFLPNDLELDSNTRIVSTYDALKCSLDEGRRPFYKLDIHPAAEGHRSIAASIYEALQDGWASGALPRK